ncbi:MAG: hypothetical protein LBJ18_02060, partial [Rickettsiales bacterium]|nr:hypothetical protein [Rickettsiales bacterium]
PIKTDLNQTPKVFLASFGDSRMKNSAARLISQAAAIDCFDEIYVMDERNLTPEFYDKFKDRLSIHSRGFGYWCWKPQAIKQVMDIMNDGDILLFCDIGCHLNEARRNEMLNLIERARNSSSGILAFSFSPDYTDGHWSKGDLLDYFGVRGRADITANPQLVGGVFFLRKNQLVVNMLNEWLKVFNDNFSLSDDTPSVSKNLDGFVENRHDQSIFSILAKLNKADIIAEDHFLNYTKMSESDWEKLSFPIQARRDKN